MTSSSRWGTTNDGATATQGSTRGNRIEPRLYTRVDAEVQASRIRSMTDPYEHEALRAFRERRGRELTEEIEAEPEAAAHFDEAVRQIAEGKLRPLPSDT